MNLVRQFIILWYVQKSIRLEFVFIYFLAYTRTHTRTMKIVIRKEIMLSHNIGMVKQQRQQKIIKMVTQNKINDEI